MEPVYGLPIEDGSDELILEKVVEIVQENTISRSTIFRNEMHRRHNERTKTEQERRLFTRILHR